MGMCVCGGAAIACSFGAAPSALTVLPDNKAVSSMPLATIMDNKPMVNILPFGMCMSMSNPQVAAATAAAMGALTPMPCMPVITAPWAPGCPTVLIGNKPALNQTSKLMCSWGGVIQITNPGTMNIQVP
ncbi:DUF4280 domain-containing protein [Enterocloster lavalensis]|uniref:DUF4280 domain-containing protein n=1 Tax=Enterocloster lavalensis TaxID=460384 RepID=UPI0023F086AB|nr:DUF4280 domain-containing protein [Enterocloster lavalensis]